MPSKYSKRKSPYEGRKRSYKPKSYDDKTVTFARNLQGYLRTGGSYARARYGAAELKNADQSVDLFNPLLGIPFAQIITAPHFWMGTAPAPAPNPNIMAQGPNTFQRIGRKITVKQIELHGTMGYEHAPGSFLADTLRIMVIHDSQCNGALPVYADVFEGASATDSFLNLNNSQRFKILMDKWFDFNAEAILNNADPAAAYAIPVVQSFSWKKKMNLTVEYSGEQASGELPNIKSDNCFIVVTNSKGTTLNDQYRLVFRTRVKFSDA